MSKLPLGWELVELNDIVKFNNGKGHEQYIDENGNYIVVNSKFISTNGEIRKYSNENLSPLKKGDIAMVMSDIPNGRALSKCFLIEKDNRYTLNQRICSLEAKKDDVKFLFYKLNRNKYFLKFNDGINQTNLRKNEVLDCPVELPPLEEQKKIADILSTVDEKIAFVQDSINQTEELKKALMQKLLTEGIGHTEFKDSELGKIPKSWRIVKLEEVCSKIVGGGTPSKNESTYWENGTIPWVTPSEFTKSKSKFISTTENKITEDGLKNSSSILLEVGTVIMSSRATIGECKINTIEITTNQGFISFKCNDSLYNLYLLFLLIFNKNNILKISSGSTFLEVSRTSMKNFNIHFPPFEEQKQIAEILSTIDEKLEVLRDKKEHFEELKKGLMQKLLTEEIRV